MEHGEDLLAIINKTLGHQILRTLPGLYQVTNTRWLG
jgi:hypothetical protein